MGEEDEEWRKKQRKLTLKRITGKDRSNIQCTCHCMRIFVIKYEIFLKQKQRRYLNDEVFHTSNLVENLFLFLYLQVLNFKQTEKKKKNWNKFSILKEDLVSFFNIIMKEEVEKRRGIENKQTRKNKNENKTEEEEENNESMWIEICNAIRFEFKERKKKESYMRIP